MRISNMHGSKAIPKMTSKKQIRRKSSSSRPKRFHEENFQIHSQHPKNDFNSNAHFKYAWIQSHSQHPENELPTLTQAWNQIHSQHPENDARSRTIRLPPNQMLISKWCQIKNNQIATNPSALTAPAVNALSANSTSASQLETQLTPGPQPLSFTKHNWPCPTPSVTDLTWPGLNTRNRNMRNNQYIATL